MTLHISAISMHRAVRRASVSVVVMAASACGGHDATIGPGSTPVVPVPAATPVAGRLVAVFTTPNADDGAVMASVSGGVIDSVSIVPGAGSLIQVVSPSNTSARIVVLASDAKTISSGALFNVWVRDIAKVAQYSISVDQAASRVTFQQTPTGGYALRLASP